MTAKLNEGQRACLEGMYDMADKVWPDVPGNEDVAGERMLANDRFAPNPVEVRYVPHARFAMALVRLGLLEVDEYAKRSNRRYRGVYRYKTIRTYRITLAGRKLVEKLRTCPECGALGDQPCIDMTEDELAQGLPREHHVGRQQGF